jgi:acylphosphatase
VSDQDFEDEWRADRRPAKPSGAPVSRAVHLNITGRVQGVGYRAFVESQAKALAISGWVRNRRDGSVEVVAVGPTDSVESLIAACTRGSAGSKVVDVEIADYSGTFLPGFMVLPTE